MHLPYVYMRKKGEETNKAYETKFLGQFLVKLEKETLKALVDSVSAKEVCSHKILIIVCFLC